MSQSLRTTIAGPKVPTFLKAIDGTAAVLKNQIANNVISAVSLRYKPSVRTTAQLSKVVFIGRNVLEIPH